VLKWFIGYENDKDVRRNFFLNTFDGALFSFGMSFISLSTVMPVFVKKLTGNNFFVGLIPVLWTIGFNFPQILMANYVRRLPYKKPLLLITAFGQRLPFLLLALFTWWFVDNAILWVQIVTFFMLFFMGAVCGSLNLPGWFDLVAKVTPVNIRGRLFASRALIGALLGIFGGIYVSFILKALPYPDNFSVLFLSAFTVMMISYILLFLIIEKEPNHQKFNVPFAEFIKRIPLLLKTNFNYRRYLIADGLLISSLLADAFYAINAIEKFNLPESYAGIFTIIMMSSIISGNILFGFLADKKGHKINLQLAALSCFATAVISLIAASEYIYLIVFVFAGFTTTLIQLSRLTIIAELCAENDRPTYVAVTNMMTSPFILLGIAGGWIASNYGYNIVFIAAAFFALCSTLWFAFKVKEPRTLIPITVQNN
jgi:MFS family permease